MQKRLIMDKYAVIGHPIAHTKSPLIHQQFAKQTHQDIEYVAIEAPLDGFKATVLHFQQQGACGANITLPFKHQAFLLADQKSESAEQAQVANTLLFQTDGRIDADNTDGSGLIQDLTHNHHLSLRQKRILLLGAGGSASGIIHSLLEQAPSKLLIANRTVSKALTLAETLNMPSVVSAVGLEELTEGPYDLIINSTSAGLTGKSLNLPADLIGEHTVCYDLMYGDQTTPFLTWAKGSGAVHCIDGLGMLVEQAAAAFYLWRGVYPDTSSVITLLRAGRNPET